MNQNKDLEYLKFIDSVVEDKSLSWVQRMDKLLDYLRERKKANGGIHLTLGPDDQKISNEDIAQDFCVIEKARASGTLTPIYAGKFNL